MTSRNADLHGNAPDKCDLALLLIDVVNDFEFPDGDKLFENAMQIAPTLSRFVAEVRTNRVPVVFVNDNFGRWRSDFQAHVRHCLCDQVRGKPFVAQLQPTDRDYFVLKPKHSGFFSTSLDILLKYLETKTLILTGLATNICVLFTANDAYMRDFQLLIPEDCVTANTDEAHQFAMEEMKSILKADIRPSSTIHLRQLIDTGDRRSRSMS